MIFALFEYTTQFVLLKIYFSHPYFTSCMQKGDGSEGARILQVYDEEMQAMQSAKNSSRMLDEAYATGAAVLLKYAEQRDRLKVSIIFPFSANVLYTESSQNLSI